MGFKNVEASAEVPSQTGAGKQCYDDVNLSNRDSVKLAFPPCDTNSANAPEQKLNSAKQENQLDFNVFPENLNISGKPSDAADFAKLYGNAQYLDFSGLKFQGLPDLAGYNRKPNDAAGPSNGTKLLSKDLAADLAAEQFPPKVALVDGAKVVANGQEAVPPAEPNVEVKANGEVKTGAEVKAGAEVIVNGEVKPKGEVQPNGEVKPNGEAQPKEATQQTLSDKVLEAAKVKKTEGYYQVAERLLGGGFDHDQRMELVNGMKTAFKATPDGQKRDDLWRGDKLLTKENMDSVLNSIKDEGLRNRIKERLMNPESMPEPKKNKKEGQQEVPEKQPKDRKRPERERQQEQPEFRPRTDVPDGQQKSPYLKRYNEGDSFRGTTSAYWQGRNTASGIPFNPKEMTAASREFPFGTVLKVTNPENGREVRVVVTDHGPFAGKKVPRLDGSGEKVHSRVLDLSLGAANHIGMGATVKNLDIKVESIPEQGKWGGDRRNIHKDYRAQTVATIRRLNNQRGRYTA